MSPWVSIMTASLKYQRDYNPGAVVEFSPVAPVTIISPVPVLLSTLLCSNFTFLIICQILFYLMTQQKLGEMSGMFCVKFNLTSRENIA